MKEVFGTSSEIDLQMAIGLLEENNIKTSIQADGAGDSFRIYGSDLALHKKILVEDSQWSKSKELLQENGFSEEQQPAKTTKTQMMMARIALAVMVAIVILIIILQFL